MAPEVLFDFTIQLMYTNCMFSSIYIMFETKIIRRFGEQLFVYILLAVVTLQAGTAQCDRYVENKPLLRE